VREQQAVEVGDGIVAVLQPPGGLGLSNSCVLIDESNATVVDTMLLPEMAEGIVAMLRHRSCVADTVVHTHHHIDHVGGNSVFTEARVVAHPSVVVAIGQMLQNITVFDWLMPEFAGHFADLVVRMPEAVDLDRLPLPCDAVPLQIGLAHSMNDSAIWCPQDRVLIAGDLCVNGVTPLLIHGHPALMIAAIDQLLALEPYVVVCGHGPLARSEDVLLLRDYLVEIVRVGEEAGTTGAGIADALAAFGPGPVAGWLEPERTRQNLTRMMELAVQSAAARPTASIASGGASTANPVKHEQK
jgi:cyclase